MNDAGYSFAGTRNIWYTRNSGDGGIPPFHTFTRTIPDMMTHMSTQWVTHPDFNCQWQQNC